MTPVRCADACRAGWARGGRWRCTIQSGACASRRVTLRVQSNDRSIDGTAVRSHARCASHDAGVAVADVVPVCAQGDVGVMSGKKRRRHAKSGNANASQSRATRETAPVTAPAAAPAAAEKDVGAGRSSATRRTGDDCLDAPHGDSPDASTSSAVVPPTAASGVPPTAASGSANSDAQTNGGAVAEGALDDVDADSGDGDVQNSATQQNDDGNGDHDDDNDDDADEKDMDDGNGDDHDCGDLGDLEARLGFQPYENGDYVSALPSRHSEPFYGTVADVRVSNGRVTYTIYWAVDGSYSLLIPHSRIVKWLRRGSSAEVAAANQLSKTKKDRERKKKAKARAIAEQAASKEAEVDALKLELDAVKAERQSVKDGGRSYSVSIKNDPSGSDIEVRVPSDGLICSPSVSNKCAFGVRTGNERSICRLSCFFRRKRRTAYVGRHHPQIGLAREGRCRVSCCLYRFYLAFAL